MGRSGSASAPKQSCSSSLTSLVFIFQPRQWTGRSWEHSLQFWAQRPGRDPLESILGSWNLSIPSTVPTPLAAMSLAISIRRLFVSIALMFTGTETCSRRRDNPPMLWTRLRRLDSGSFGKCPPARRVTRQRLSSVMCRRRSHEFTDEYFPCRNQCTHGTERWRSADVAQCNYSRPRRASPIRSSRSRRNGTMDAWWDGHGRRHVQLHARWESFISMCIN